MIWKRIGIGFGIYLLVGVILMEAGAGTASGLAGLAIGIFAGWAYPWGAFYDRHIR